MDGIYFGYMLFAGREKLSTRSGLGVMHAKYEQKCDAGAYNGETLKDFDYWKNIERLS